MTSARWQQLKNILADALEEGEGERQMFVENACGLQAELAAEALAFLGYAEETADALWFGGRFALIDAGLLAGEPSTAPLLRVPRRLEGRPKSRIRKKSKNC